MTATRNTSTRHLVPRWRPFRSAMARGELAFPPPETPRSLDHGLAEAEEDWHRYQTAAYAAEFAGAAIVAGVPERARSTIPALTATGGIRQELGESLTGHPSPDQLALMIDGMSSSRAHLARDPRNAIAWVDLSHVQMSRGHISTARKSIDIALNLAPENRFILRAAATFYTGIDDPDRAAYILAPAASASNDPWLISAEIAVSSLSGGKSRSIIRGRSQLNSGIWDQRSLSELASEIATLEAKSGKDKDAKRLFRMSLIEPTENAVAQAASISVDQPTLVPDHLLIKGTQHAWDAFEARAIQSEIESNFAAASEYSVAWLDDQPFSLLAATYASYITASGMQDWSSAIELARRGLMIHRDDSLLLNNLAYAMTEAGQDLAMARRLIAQAERGKDAMKFAATIAATKGLLEYRTGNAAAGRRLYNLAAATAKKAREFDVEATALVMHAGEVENRHDALRMLGRAKRIAGDKDAVLKLLLERAESSIRSKRQDMRDM